MVINSKQEVLDFSLLIENLSREKRITYMDAILFHCDKTGLEVEVAAKMINNHIKNKIKLEGEELNFLPKPKVKKLPIMRV